KERLPPACPPPAASWLGTEGGVGRQVPSPLAGRLMVMRPTTSRAATTRASGPSPAATARPLGRGAERNHQRLLGAAAAVFPKRGLEARLDEVARHAGVGVGTARPTGGSPLKRHSPRQCSPSASMPWPPSPSTHPPNRTRGQAW